MAFAGKIASIETYGTGMIVVGDMGNINVEIENQGSDRFKVMAMYAYNGATLPETGWEAYRIVQLERGITVYPGESSMNTYIYTMCDPGIEQGRWCTAYLHVRCEVFPEGGASYEAWLPARAIARPVLDMRYLPKVESFSAARTPSEDSAQVAVNVRCSLADGADAAYSGLTLTLKWRESGETAFAQSTSLSVASALAAGGASLTLTQAFPQTKAYEFEAVFTDGYMSDYARTLLGKSFVNMHLAGSGYGVAVGRYSAGTQDAPLFECDYPARFYAGIEGYMAYATTEKDTGMRWIDGKAIYCRVFTGTTLTDGGMTLVGNISGMDALIRGDGYGKMATGGFVPVNFAYYNNMQQMLTFNIANDGGVYMYKGTAWTCVEYALAVFYTKA